MNISGPASRVAIAVPFHSLALSDDERLSWRSLVTTLPEVPTYIVAPDRLRREKGKLPPAKRVFFFPDKYFTYPHGYNSLLLSKRFYARFESFEYLLVYQLDCLVCKNDLGNWCSKHWDYIGAPWPRNFDPSTPLPFEGVGNGGFSLRKVQAALRVLRLRVKPVPDYTMGPPPRWWHWQRVRKARCTLRNFNRFLPRVSLETYLRRYYLGNEDVFWGRYAARFDPTFRVAGVDEALDFAFETDPAGSLSRNRNRLPFGAHAWARYGREFWSSCGVLPGKANGQPLAGTDDRPHRAANSTEKTLAIVTPSLNQAGFVPEMVASLRTSGCPRLEHVVFDAGSTDGSVEAWREWEAENNESRSAEYNRESSGNSTRVKLFVEPDNGQSDAINKGMRVASGEIVGWLNADDVLMPGALDKVARAFGQNPQAVCVYGVGAKADRSGKVMRKVPFRPFSERRLRAAFGAVQPAMFFKRDAYWAVGGLDESLHYAMDWDLLLKLSKIGKVVAIPDHLANIRYYEETKTNTGGWKRMREIARIARRHNGILDRNYLSFRLRTLLTKQPFRWPRVMFDHLCWNIFRDPPLMVQGWPEEAQS